jgi:hypothetical protein
MTRVLFLTGGWPGHRPRDVAAWAHGVMSKLEFEVDTINDPHELDQDLRPYDDD